MICLCSGCGEEFDGVPEGGHRLMCGDSTSAADVAVLAAGLAPALCFTSPPYAQQRDYKSGGIEDWDRLMQGVFGALPVAADAQVLVNLGLVHRDNEWHPYWDGWIAWMRAQGWRRFGWYVWDQGPGLPGNWNGRLAPSHEFIFHFNRTAEAARKTVKTKYGGQETHLRKDGSSTSLRDKAGKVGSWAHAGRVTQDRRIPDSVVRVLRRLDEFLEALLGLSDEDTAHWPESVVRIMRHKARGIERGHPAVFPVALVSEMMTAFSDAGDVVYEPFSGSGTQLISATINGRVCLAMELAPAYVDLAVRRWQAFTGEVAVRESDGAVLDEVRAEELARETRAADSNARPHA